MLLYQRIKKYIFLLSLAFAIGFLLHLATLYLYEGAEKLPERGGSFSIGLVAKSPSLSPTEYGIDGSNDFILSFLYRGLVHYNQKTHELEGDLANCDLSKSLGEIRCAFKSGSTWSDGSRITIEDALSSYALYAETDINRSLKTKISRFAITRENESIVFRSSSPSTESLELLSVPILKKANIEEIRAGKTPADIATSGAYILSKREQNPATGSESITLAHTQFSGAPTEYARLIIRIFSNEEGLVGSKDSLNLIYPGTYEVTDMGSRFVKKSSPTPNFVGAFINSERLNIEQRSLLLRILSQENSQKDLLGDSLQKIKNPFFTDESIIPVGSGSLSSEADILTALAKIGFARKTPETSTEGVNQSASGTTAKTEPTPPVAPANPVTTPVAASTGSVTVTAPSTAIVAPVVPPAAIKTPATSAPTAPARLSFFDTPNSEKRTVIVGLGEVLIAGRVPANTLSASINGYRLKGYEPGSSRFTYRARGDLRNLGYGKNTYTLSVTGANGSRILESKELWVAASEAEASKIRDSWNPKIVIPPPVTESNTGTTAPAIASTAALQSTSSTGAVIATGSTNSTSSTNSGGVATETTNTGTVLPAKVNPVVSVKKEAPSRDLYTRDGKRATFQIRVLNPLGEISMAAESIKNTLESLGFAVNIDEVDGSIESLQNVTKRASKNYDILVTGVNLGYMGTYISPYLHSGQVQDGFNFSLLRNQGLDILLEELSTRNITGGAKTQIFSKISALLRKEAVLLPIGAIEYHFFVDKLVRDFGDVSLLLRAREISGPMRESYLGQQYIVNFSIKSFSGFMQWMHRQLFPTSQSSIWGKL